MPAFEHLICAVLRRESPRWSPGGEATSIASFLNTARYHGVLPLLGVVLSHQELYDWPHEIVLACREGARVQAVHELAYRAATIQVLDALAKATVSPLVLKGSGLAYTLYEDPALRPRGDCDLLIQRSERSAAERALASTGYVKHDAVEGELIASQACWTRAAAFGADHVVDLHWRANNSQILAQAVDYDEMAARSVPVPKLGPHARTLCPIDALVFACVHRAGHIDAPYFIDGAPRHGIDRLIWLYDIHLIVSKLSDAELDQFAALAAEKRVKAICLDALSRSIALLGTTVPSRFVERLAPDQAVEPSAVYLTGSRSRLMLENFLARESWSERMGWMRELAFPPARYMRSKYPEALVQWLPVLYARRGLTGISRLLAGRDSR